MTARPSRRALLALAGATLVACPTVLLAQAQSALGTEPLTIVTAAGARHPFTVEVARTPDQQAQGLMFRRSLAPDRGMLFDFGDVRPRAMWMQNTYVSPASPRTRSPSPRGRSPPGSRFSRSSRLSPAPRRGSG
jgi:hypothetical protein